VSGFTLNLRTHNARTFLHVCRAWCLLRFYLHVRSLEKAWLRAIKKQGTHLVVFAMIHAACHVPGATLIEDSMRRTPAWYTVSHSHGSITKRFLTILWYQKLAGSLESETFMADPRRSKSMLSSSSSSAVLVVTLHAHCCIDKGDIEQRSWKASQKARPSRGNVALSCSWKVLKA
jgi:hypothetical protein